MGGGEGALILNLDRRGKALIRTGAYSRGVGVGANIWLKQERRSKWGQLNIVMERSRTC